MDFREVLASNYNNLCNAYINEFCRKQEITPEDKFWIGGEIGGVVCLAECYLNFTDIVLDVNENHPKGKIFDWYYYVLENIDNAVNYRTYLKMEVSK